MREKKCCSCLENPVAKQRRSLRFSCQSGRERGERENNGENWRGDVQMKSRKQAVWGGTWGCLFLGLGFLFLNWVAF